MVRVRRDALEVVDRGSRIYRIVGVDAFGQPETLYLRFRDDTNTWSFAGVSVAGTQSTYLIRFYDRACTDVFDIRRIPDGDVSNSRQFQQITTLRGSSNMGLPFNTSSSEFHTNRGVDCVPPATDLNIVLSELQNAADAEPRRRA